MNLFVANQQLRVSAITTSLYRPFCSFSSLLRMMSEDDIIRRQKTTLQQRCAWTRFVLLHKNRPLLARHLRMSNDSFMAFLEQIKIEFPSLDEEMAALRGGMIIPELRLYLTLRYLAGGDYSCICGISVSSFYRCLWVMVDAVNKAIQISFPSTPEECALHASSFQSVSHHRIISNCVGAVDGYLLAINTPAKKHAKNVRSYFSGHYQRYGVNIQACCDAHYRFTFLGIGGPGVMKDPDAVRESGLLELINNLPLGYVMIGNSAYQPSENLVTIFCAELALQKDNDNFNFFALQLRIRIEMAFGMMASRKWGILQRPLSIALPQVKHLICCIACLYHFCINVKLLSKSFNNPSAQL